MRRAVGYTRVSSFEQGVSGYSLESQVLEIEKFCQTNNLELVAHFLEVESAATIKQRPVWKACVFKHVCHENIADVIVVTNLDRASRCVLDYEVISFHLERKNKLLVSTQQAYLTPLQIAQDDESFDFLRSAQQQEMIRAAQERRIIRRRCLKGKRRKVESGGWIGHRPAYGYEARQGSLCVDLEQVAVLRLIRRLSNWAGLSLQKIADYLNGRNRLVKPDGTRGRIFPSPSARPPMKARRKVLRTGLTGLWHKTTIWRLLIRAEKGLDISISPPSIVKSKSNGLFPRAS